MVRNEEGQNPRGKEEMLRNAVNNRADFGGRKSVRRAVRRVLQNPRPWLGFFAALFLIQTLFCVLFFSVATDLVRTKEAVESRFDYDIAVHAMTQPQYAALFNQCGTEPPEDEIWRPYRFVRYVHREDGVYDAYVALRGTTAKDAYAYFTYLYLGSVEAVDPDVPLMLSYSPRYQYNAAYLPGIWGFSSLSLAVVLCISVFLLWQLFRMRLDGESYTYGIYMTCGADGRKLRRVAAAELYTLSCITLFPALAAGVALCVLLSAAGGVSPAWEYCLPALLASVAFSVLTVFLSVQLPMGRLANKTPVSLLAARDNSAFVVSPRGSFRIYGASFPAKYELISLWRYRKYLAWLLVSAVLLPVLFLATVTLTDIREVRSEAEAPDFTVAFSAEADMDPLMLNLYTEKIALDLAAVEGVAYCRPEPMETAATAIDRHLLFRSENDAGAGKVSVAFQNEVENTAIEEAQTYTRATNRLNYTALDAAAIAVLEQTYRNIEGDLSSVLASNKTVVLSESIYNTKRFDFHVGDTVLLATSADRGTVDVVFSDKEGILRQQLSGRTYGYEAFTVGAVIHDEAAGDSLLLGMNTEVYASLTGNEPVRRAVNVYLEEGLDFSRWETLADAVYAEAACFYHCTAVDHGVFFSRTLNALQNREGRMLLLAWSFCLMAPIICFFSQLRFYGKREKEMEMLASLGATEESLRKLSLFSGLCTAGLAFSLTALCGFLSEAVLFRLFNEWLPSGAFISSVRLDLRVPWWALGVTLLVSLLCGLLPLVVVEKRRQKHARERNVGLLQGD